MKALQLLKLTFEERREKNPRYSLRAFSRDLHIDASLLSRIMAGTRSITAEQAYKLGLFLELSDKDTLDLIKSTFDSLPGPHAPSELVIGLKPITPGE